MTKLNGTERDLAAARRTRRAAVAAVAAIFAGTVAVFVGHDPTAQPYEIRGVFASSNGLRNGSPVRIAGVAVGAVTGIERGPGNTSIVSMRIDGRGRPIHRDAELAIKPRLLLEGNFSVALRPGTPSAPELPSGGLVPRARTTVPVQIDQVLSTFDLATRGALHRTISELGAALGPDPGADPSGRSAAPRGSRALRSAVDELRRTLPSASKTAGALRGTAPGDLGRTVRSVRDVTTQLAADPVALADGVTNFRRLTGVLAEENTPLRATTRSFARLLRVAPPALRAVDAALPATTRFADALTPALRTMPGPLRQTDRLLTQLKGLFRANELPALVDDLSPTLRRLPPVERELLSLAPLLTQANRCLSSRVTWMLNQKLQDGANTTGDPVYLDAAHAETASGGIVAGFDGNGVAIRAGLTQDGTALNGVIPGLGHVVGRTPKITGIRPAWLGYGVEPPYRPDERCADQPRPDLTARSAPAPTLPTGGRTVRVGGILP